MKRSVISAIALSAAMMLSTGAFAQTMVGQQSVSEADLPKVQAQCNTLASVDNESLGTETSATEGSEAPDGASDLGTETEVPNGTDQATATVDLTIITIEECKAAGLAQ